MPWYLYTGGGATDPLNYSAIGGTAPTTCSGTDQICAIFAPTNDSLPDLNEQVKDNMINALNSRTDILGSVLLKSF